MSKRALLEDSEDESEHDTQHSASHLPDAKLSRQEPIAQPDRDTITLTCTLPPKCDIKPRTFHDVSSFEAHHDRYHLHVCQACHATFPTTGFLSLHLQELHDPLWAARRDRGEKVFECFEAYCEARFKSATGRRRHLEKVHAYPPEFRFNLIKRGMTKNTKSLLYETPLKTRPACDGMPQTEDPPQPQQQQQQSSGNRAQRRAQAKGTSLNHRTEAGQNEPAFTTPQTRKQGSAKKDALKAAHADSVHALFAEWHDPGALALPRIMDQSDEAMDDLADRMHHAAVVPPQIRFGQRRAK